MGIIETLGEVTNQHLKYPSGYTSMFLSYSWLKYNMVRQAQNFSSDEHKDVKFGHSLWNGMNKIFFLQI